MTKKRILFISQEIAPYISSNPAASLGRQLPTTMQSKGFEVRTFMPKFGAVNERRNQLHEVIRLSGMNIVINDNDHPLIIKVASLQPSRIQVYFIDNDDFFQKLDSDADHSGSNRGDNDERAIFFARGAMETAKKLRWDPFVIQCSGWITALVPLYLKKFYSDDPSFKTSHVVYNITEGSVPAQIDPAIIAKLKADGFTQRDLKKLQPNLEDPMFLHKTAIENSHAVIISDPNASQELIEYVKASGKPYLIANECEPDMEAYNQFYNSL